MLSRRTLVVALIAFLAAIAGVFVGRAILPARPALQSELHELLHHGIKLDNAQQTRLAMLEDRFATRRKALELELRADNASHQAMGELQKATLAHIFAMRQILKPDQVPAFDHAVVEALTADTR